MSVLIVKGKINVKRWMCNYDINYEMNIFKSLSEGKVSHRNVSY